MDGFPTGRQQKPDDFSLAFRLDGKSRHSGERRRYALRRDLVGLRQQVRVAREHRLRVVA
jgi:hypothetical protein